MSPELDINYAYLQAGRFAKAAVCLSNRMVGTRLSPDFEPVDILPMFIMDGTELRLFPEFQTKPDFDFSAPFVVNAALSLELYLKILLYLEDRRWRKNHNLSTLFEQLTPESKKHVKNDFLNSCRKLSKTRDLIRQNSSLKDFDWDLDELLQTSSNAFVEYRYAFEKKLGSFVGFWELKTALVRRIEDVWKAAAVNSIRS